MIFKDDKANRGILNDKGKVVPLSALLGRQFVSPFQVTMLMKDMIPKKI